MFLITLGLLIALGAVRSTMAFFLFYTNRQCTIRNVGVFSHFDLELSLELSDLFFSKSTLLDMSSIYVYTIL